VAIADERMVTDGMHISVSDE